MSEGADLRIAGGRPLGVAGAAVAAAVLDHAIWVVTCRRGEHLLGRFDRSGAAISAPIELGELGAEVAISAPPSAPGLALIEGDRAVIARQQGSDVAIEWLGERGRDRRVLLGSRGVAVRCGRTISPVRAGTSPVMALPADLASGTIAAGALVLDGTAALIEVVQRDRAIALVYDLRGGGLRTRIRLGSARVLAAADRAGVVVLGYGAQVALLDVRAGRCVSERILAAPVVAGAIDAGGERVVCIDAEGRVSELGRALTDEGAERVAGPAATDEEGAVVDGWLTAPGAEGVTAGSASAAEAGERAAAGSASAAATGERTAAVDGPPAVTGGDPGAQADAAPGAASALADPPFLIALGAPAHPLLTGPALEAYLDDTHGWILALCRTAVALAADEPASDDEIERGRAGEREATEAFAAWGCRGAPHVELAVELGLSPMATTVLLLAAAPQIWGELAGAYALCTGDPARPLVDELLLAHLLEADLCTRGAIGRELDEDAPLLRTGAVELGRGVRPYAGITVHPAIARRLAGAAPAEDPAPAGSPCALSEVIGPRGALEALVRSLAAEQPAPVRVVLRGRPAAGRRTIARALAAGASRKLGLVSADASEPEAVRARLRDVALRGDLPCVTIDPLADDPAARRRLRQILEAHPGPLFVRAPLGGELPLGAGYLALELAPLAEGERRAAWRTMLQRHGLAPELAEGLAARFAVGPGAIQRACAAVGAAAGPGPIGAGEALATALRQHRAARIESTATRVERLAAWDDLIIPPEIEDALREVISRARHRCTVLEDWGMGRVAVTAQGVTALFQGGAGTGKTLAAGAIARALGYELWRVDLSKVMSKWLGETEKNLGAVLDAAEDGEIVLLFDEADSLFGRRTEVKSSQDRHANAETNYLLQRLDTFTGIAILTTNLGTAIDPAFRRRLSVQVQFPFPDEADRERLWRAHLPPSLPIAGDLDLGDLARRHQLSGGYIRNAALRAAYLAAAEGSRLSTDHLRRAVALEYQRAGKLGDGRLE